MRVAINSPLSRHFEKPAIALAPKSFETEFPELDALILPIPNGPHVTSVSVLPGGWFLKIHG
jgi:hypothetical protein